jgi:hypothetical protein
VVVAHEQPGLRRQRQDTPDGTEQLPGVAAAKVGARRGARG